MGTAVVISAPHIGILRLDPPLKDTWIECGVYGAPVAVGARVTSALGARVAVEVDTALRAGVAVSVGAQVAVKRGRAVSVTTAVGTQVAVGRTAVATRVTAGVGR